MYIVSQGNSDVAKEREGDGLRVETLLTFFCSDSNNNYKSENKKKKKHNFFFTKEKKTCVLNMQHENKFRHRTEI